MKYLIYVYIPLVILFITGNKLLAQSSLDANFKKPEAVLPSVASIMKYIDYPIDLNSGLINIEIPLYILQEGDLTLPISISYHASGLKVREISGKVGQGWTLNAEPSISRSIEGEPDERGYLKTYVRPAPSYNPYEKEENMIKGVYDMTPDIFYYKLLDKSGKFYFNRDLSVQNSPAEIVIQPYEPINIMPNDAFINTFDVVDDKGVKYNFGGAYGKVNAKITQWMASKITSASGKYNINFGYKPIEKKLAGIVNYNPYYIAIEEDIDTDLDCTSTNGCFSIFQCGQVQFPIMTKHRSIPNQDIQMETFNIMPDNEEDWRNINGDRYYTGMTGENLRAYRYDCMFSYTSGAQSNMTYQAVDAITTGTIEIKFYYDPQLGDNDEEPLDKIEIKDKIKNEVIRTIYFSQSPYNKSYPYDRRKLDEIRIAGKDGITVERYTFDYNNNNLVPRIRSMGSDHWGFASSWEGRTGVPIHQITAERKVMDQLLRWDKLEIEIGDVNKDVSDAGAGILKSITYPTGRKSTFYFEKHRYEHDNVYQATIEGREKNLWIPDREIKDAGGLRIAKIEEYEPVSDSKLTKVYKYGKNENGLGYIKHQPSMKDYTYEYDMINKTGTYTTFESRVRMFLPESLANMLYGGGSSTKYDYVTEYWVSENGLPLNNGKTVHKFKFDYPSMNSHTRGTTINFNYDSEWATGQLLEKTIYKSAEISIPIHRTTYEYDYFKSKSIPVSKAYKYVQFRFFDTTEEREYLIHRGNPYIYETSSIQSGCKRIKSEITDSFDTNGNLNVTEIKTYNYGNENHLYPTTIEIKEGKAFNKREKMTYPQDVKNPNNAESMLVKNSQLNTLLKKETDFGNRIWVNKNIYDIREGNPVTVSIWAGEKNKEEERVQILQYDVYGNPMYIQKDGGFKGVYIWGYNGTRLIAEIQNATYEQVKSALGGNDPASYSLQNSFPSAINNLYTNTAILDNALISTYKYDSVFGITEATDPSGRTTYYKYDSFGRLQETYYEENKVKEVLEQYEYNYRNK